MLIIASLLLYIVCSNSVLLFSTFCACSVIFLLHCALNSAPLTRCLKHFPASCCRVLYMSAEARTVERGGGRKITFSFPVPVLSLSPPLLKSVARLKIVQWHWQPSQSRDYCAVMPQCSAVLIDIVLVKYETFKCLDRS